MWGSWRLARLTIIEMAPNPSTRFGRAPRLIEPGVPLALDPGTMRSNVSDDHKGPHGTDEMLPLGAQSARDKSSQRAPKTVAEDKPVAARPEEPASDARPTPPVVSSDPEGSRSTHYQPAGKVMLAGAAAAAEPKTGARPKPGGLTAVMGADEPPPAGKAPVSPTAVMEDDAVPPAPKTPYFQSPTQRMAPAPEPIARRGGGNTGFILGVVIVVGALIALGVWQISRSKTPEPEEAKTVPLKTAASASASSATSTASATTTATTTDTAATTTTTSTVASSTSTTTTTSTTTHTTPTGSTSASTSLSGPIAIPSMTVPPLISSWLEKLPPPPFPSASNK